MDTSTLDAKRVEPKALDTNVKTSEQPVTPAVDPNIHEQEIGDAVRTGDIAPYAKRACRWCFGKGELTYTSMNNPRKGATPARISRPCGCAVRRFIKNCQVDTVMLTTGQLAWKKGKEPANRPYAKAKVYEPVPPLSPEEERGQFTPVTPAPETASAVASAPEVAPSTTGVADGQLP